MAFLAPEDTRTHQGLDRKAELLRENGSPHADFVSRIAKAYEILERRANRIELSEGKYTAVIQNDALGQGEILRYGKPWRQMNDDPTMFAFVREAEFAQRSAAALSAVGPHAVFEAELERASNSLDRNTILQLEAAGRAFTRNVNSLHPMSPDPRAGTTDHFNSLTPDGRWQMVQPADYGLFVIDHKTDNTERRIGDNALLAAGYAYEEALAQCRTLGVGWGTYSGADLQRWEAANGAQSGAENIAPGLRSDVHKEPAALRSEISNAAHEIQKPLDAVGREDRRDSSAASMVGPDLQDRRETMAATTAANTQAETRTRNADRFKDMAPDALRQAFQDNIDAATRMYAGKGPKLVDGKQQHFESFQVRVRAPELQVLLGKKSGVEPDQLSAATIATLKTFSTSIRQPEFVSKEGGKHERTGVVHSGKKGLAHLAAEFGDEKLQKGGFRSRAVHLNREELKKAVSKLSDERVEQVFKNFREMQSDTISRSKVLSKAVSAKRNAERSGQSAGMGD